MAQSGYDKDLADAIAASAAEEAKRAKELDALVQRAIKDSKVQVSADPRAAHHLTLYHYPQRADQKEGYFKIKIPGGGNCGFYAAALGIINFILQDKIKLTTEKYNQLLDLLKEGKAREDINTRLAFYRTGDNPKRLNPPRLEKCVPFIEAILREVDQGNLGSLDQLKVYILQNMHSQQDKDYFLESMLIVLGPALREISCLEFKELERAKKSFGDEKKGGRRSELLDTSHIEMQPKDGENAPEEQLNLLAGFFGFEFQAYIKSPKAVYFKSFVTSEASQEVTHPLARIAAAPLAPTDKKSEFKECEKFIEPEKLAIQLVYNPVAQHWDLLLPRQELQSPPYLFSPFKSRMIEEQVEPEIISLPQYLSRLKEADQGKPAFDSDSYLLIAGERKSEKPWHFVYVNTEGMHQSVEIGKVKGLEEAIKRLPKKDPGNIEAREKKGVTGAVVKYRKENLSLLGDAKSEVKGDAVFDEEQLPETLKQILDEAKENQKKIFSLLGSVAAFEVEVKKIADAEEKKIGENLTQALRETVNTLVDPLAQDDVRIIAYRKCLTKFDAALTGMPSMTPSCLNTLLNIITGILTFGIWHSIQRYQTGQWTLFNDLKANFYHTKREFASLTERVKKLDNESKANITPGGGPQ